MKCSHLQVLACYRAPQIFLLISDSSHQHCMHVSKKSHAPLHHLTMHDFWHNSIMYNCTWVHICINTRCISRITTKKTTLYDMLDVYDPFSGFPLTKPWRLSESRSSNMVGWWEFLCSNSPTPNILTVYHAHLYCCYSVSLCPVVGLLWRSTLYPQLAFKWWGLLDVIYDPLLHPAVVWGFN